MSFFDLKFDSGDGDNLVLIDEVVANSDIVFTTSIKY